MLQNFEKQYLLVNELQFLPRHLSDVVALLREGWAQRNHWRHNLGD